MSKTTWSSKYFFGNEISEYGQEQGYIDYATLAKSFQHVLNNDIMSIEPDCWEQENGIDNTEEIEAINEKIEELEDQLFDIRNSDYEDEREQEDRIEEIEQKIDILENDRYELEQETETEIFQFFIISEAGADILKDYTEEIVYYNSILNMYVWGVTHYGTAWDYVLTDIKIETENN